MNIEDAETNYGWELKAKEQNDQLKLISLSLDNITENFKKLYDTMQEDLDVIQVEIANIIK